MKINPLATLDDVQPDDLDSGPVVVLNFASSLESQVHATAVLEARRHQSGGSPQ